MIFIPHSAGLWDGYFLYDAVYTKATLSPLPALLLYYLATITFCCHIRAMLFSRQQKTGLELEEIDVQIWYLEMLDAKDFNASWCDDPDFEIRQAKEICPELNRFMYTAVGGDYHWIDRLGWNWDQWYNYLTENKVETWIAYVKGTPAGYYDLEFVDNEAKIAYFGLMNAFTGRGYGKHLLSAAIKRCWEREPERVWVHTCSMDHPYALQNYQDRGFKIYKDYKFKKWVPRKPIGPWHGSRRKKN